jgi:uncharacterized protein YfiM (DUF2279 family)
MVIRMVFVRRAVAMWMLSSVAGSCAAYDGFTSEFSHAVAGAAMAAAGTAIAHHWEVEHRGWVGFGVSSAIGLVAEAIQVASSTHPNMRSAWLDAGSNMLGAAFGAWVTDRYLVMPVVTKDSAGRSKVRIVVQAPF